MRITRAVAPALAVLLAAPARADETPAKGKVVAADLFKNGLAVVRCEVTLGRPGEYVLEHVPTPVHGTFWVESAAPVEAAVKVRDVTVLGVPDERWGSAVGAVVSLNPGATVTPEELAGFVGDRLAGYKKPRRIVVVDEVQRLVTGKSDLRDKLRNNLFFDISGPPQWGKKQLECAVEVLGEDNILYGASYPIRKDWFFDGVPTIEALDVSDGVKAKLFSKNAEKLFGI